MINAKVEQTLNELYEQLFRLQWKNKENLGYDKEIADVQRKISLIERREKS